MRRPQAALLACALIFAGLTTAFAETRPFQRGSWTEIRSAHADRPLIVHVWGLSCGPCLVELPDWAELMRSHPGADMVLINGDRPGDKLHLADERIAKAGLGAAEQWAFAEAHTDRLRFEIDAGWQGELPFTLLIGRDGGVTSFSGSADFAMLAAWIDSQRP